MDIKIDQGDVKKFQYQLDSVLPNIKEVIKKATINVRNEAVNLIQKGPASGRIYKRGNTFHRASSEKEPPMSDTGRLAGSMQFEFKDNGMTGLTGPTVDYGRYLEEGTAIMRKRPYMVPALEEEIPNIERMIQSAVGGALKGN